MMSYETPVLIVGGGPVGLALAGDLGWRGVPFWCALMAMLRGPPTMNPMMLPR